MELFRISSRGSTASVPPFRRRDSSSPPPQHAKCARAGGPGRRQCARFPRGSEMLGAEIELLLFGMTALWNLAVRRGDENGGERFAKWKTRGQETAQG